MATEIVHEEQPHAVAGREAYNAMHVDRPALTMRCTGTADRFNYNIVPAASIRL
jgi:hypothetical protein